MSDLQGHLPGDPSFRRVSLALFFAGFAMFVQLFDVQAVLPELSAEFDASPASAALTVAAGSVGIAVSVVPWATLSDRVGRVPVMKWAIMGSGILGLVSPLAPTLELLVISRFLIGLGLGAIVAVAMAYLAEEIHAPYVASAASTFVAGNGFGALFGRIVAGLVTEWTTWRIGIGVLAVVAFALAIGFITIVPPSRRFSPRERGTARELPRAFGRIFRDRGLVALLVSTFFLTAIVAIAYNYVGFRLLSPEFSVPPTLSVLVYAVFAIGSATVYFVGRVVRRVGRVRILIGAYVAGASGAVVMNATHLVPLILGLALVTMGAFTAQALLSGWVPQHARRDRALSTATYQLAGQSGAALLGWGVGLLFGAMGWAGVTGAIVVAFLLALTLVVTVLREVERSDRT
ncbi:MFS transporter [Microbacterium sp. LWH7-1.2]|uniref:MFS transporter n=1 Tax=Microbacterium sp. LWH7-1.2 TaxID=3135257 RepID=UPI003139E0FB